MNRQYAGKDIMKLATGHNVGKEIADVLGLKHCNLLDIRIRSDRFVSVIARFNLEVDEVMQFPAILKKYQLVEIEEDKKDK